MNGPLRCLRSFTLASVVAPALLAQAGDNDPRTAQPERPTVATHAGSVAPGFLEIETGIQFDRMAGEWNGTTLPSVFKTGLSPATQLEITLPFLGSANRAIRVGDVTASLKWRFIETSPIGRVAIQPSVKLPSGSEPNGYGTGTTDLQLLLISSKTLGPAQMDLNLGYTHRSGDGTSAPKDATVWTASFGGPARGPVGWVVECFGYPKTSGPAGQPSTAAILAGPTFTAHRWLVFDTGVIVPLTGWLPHSAYVGLTWNAGHL
jgi:hypothetical protein